MDGSSDLLRPQLADLKSAFDIRCLSIPSDDVTGWDGLIEQIADLIVREKQRSPSRRIYLCGESFGGCLGLKLAAQFPRLCDRLILVNPASSASRQPWLDFGASVAQRLPSPLYRLSTLGLLPLLIAPLRVSIPSQQDLLTAMQSVSPPSAAWRLSLLRQFVLEELPLERIEQPVLVLASGSDRLLPSVEEAGKLESYLPNSQTVLLPDSGHACLLEKDVGFRNILKLHSFCFDGSMPALSLSR
ncbi:alpha/beta hydrolase [Synechococcus sp. Cruz-9H2]|nr:MULTISPECIES: alpha/beta hydrolase [unclassified Synechococcus]MCP9820965.1 alpha/beta hydrolase [Synechococcus sp. Cruz-9H2]MCP9845200.1 alpha/beta hydrolase [Synechococcus sp. Edmonson 11F2]MCP9857371.1 alpha/beta hydrolase [Synechococcus sp. Cruz-9C9]MCP9864616.1 alpha/beta hydrolase [Synechococcus sp. Cruz-7E5]MCP9871886.1 alpha/beta hydrolase [Synechococcus sp. Cruz-7B9]